MNEDADLWLFVGFVWSPILFGVLVLLSVGLWFIVGRALDRRYLNRVRDGRCWKCNYELCGISSDRCPECGMPITRPCRSSSP